MQVPCIPRMWLSMTQSIRAVPNTHCLWPVPTISTFLLSAVPATRFSFACKLSRSVSRRNSPRYFRILMAHRSPNDALTIVCVPLLPSDALRHNSTIVLPLTLRYRIVFQVDNAYLCRFESFVLVAIREHRFLMACEPLWYSFGTCCLHFILLTRKTWINSNRQFRILTCWNFNSEWKSQVDFRIQIRRRYHLYCNFSLSVSHYNYPEGLYFGSLILSHAYNQRSMLLRKGYSVHERLLSIDCFVCLSDNFFYEMDSNNCIEQCISLQLA